MKERQEASDAIINEKLAKLMMLRAVKIIQRWWRRIRAKRHIFLVGKKKAKNKKKVWFHSLISNESIQGIILPWF